MKLKLVNNPVYILCFEKEEYSYLIGNAKVHQLIYQHQIANYNGYGKMIELPKHLLEDLITGLQNDPNYDTDHEESLEDNKIRESLFKSILTLEARCK